MTPGPEDLAAQYAQMSETELLELARSYDGLQGIAQVTLRTEFARRGLEPPLVDEPEEWEFRRLVTVRHYRDLTEAFVGRSLLESSGIPAWVADEHLVRMNWFYSNAVGGMRLRVEERDEAAAREILEEEIPRSITYGEDETFVQPTCPSADRPRLHWATGQSEGGHLWRSTPWRFQCRRERRPGIARRVPHSGRMQRTTSRSNKLSARAGRTFA